MKLEKKSRDGTIQKISNILALEERIRFAYLHGSFLTEPAFNDIDIAVYLEDEILNQVQVDVVDFEIDESLKVEEAIGLPVDIRVLNAAPLSFRYQASLGNLLFSQDEDILCKFLSTTWRDYFDFEPVSKIYLKEVLG